MASVHTPVSNRQEAIAYATCCIDACWRSAFYASRAAALMQPCRTICQELCPRKLQQ